MSNIYIQEPPTKGKVLLVTSFGDIDIELWSREAPKACRNFVQLCLEGFYNGITFHRVVKHFIAQAGDPTGTGCHSESIYGAPFKDEIHSRLRFVRRGLVASANNGKDDNGSQFFFTLESTPELQGKHTIFGKVTGDTQYNLIKLNEIMVDHDNRPVYETKIIRAEVLVNPFEDIIPRILSKPTEQESIPKKKKKKEKGIKNYKLLSFGEEAEEDEIETLTEIKKYTGKSKSTHDVLNDPKLSSETIKNVGTASDSGEQTKEELFAQLESIKTKLNKKCAEEKSNKSETILECDNYFASQREEEKNKKLKEIRNEMKNLKREYHKEKKIQNEELETKKKKQNEKSDVIKELEEDQEKYLEIKKKIAVKGDARENFTLSLMKSFKKTLEAARTQNSDSTERMEEIHEDDVTPLGWFRGQLVSNTNEVLAKDANSKSDDWYEIYDPRNPLTKRRRENSKQQITEKIKAKYDLK